MPSVGPMNAGLKNSGGFFVPVGDCVGKVFGYTPGTGAGGSAVPGAFSTASWATLGSPTRASSIAAAGAGGVFRDGGKTVVSASRVFRKVQLLIPASVSTGGVAGRVGTTSEDYLTGYIELMSGNGASPATAAPVAYYPSMF
jgi:hypothetical protein